METITQGGRQLTLLSWQELVDPRDAGEYVRAYCPIHKGDNQRSLSVHKASGWGRCFNAACPAFGLTGAPSTVLVIEWTSGASTSLHAREGVTTILETETEGLTDVGRARTPPDWQQAETSALYQLYLSGFLRHQAHHPWAQAYLEARHIPPALARALGVGYLPAASDLPFDPWHDEHYRVGLWCSRLLFPLGVLWHDSILRMGFIGRTLYGWRPGMDENEHKAFVEDYDQQSQAHGRLPLRRWRKTNPAGCFGYEPASFDSCLVLVEGPFDRLALIASGWSPTGVVALAGTAADPSWFPRHVRTIILALDCDEGGSLVTPRLTATFERAGFRVVACLPPSDDGCGKDWSERWRKAGRGGLQPLYDVVARV